MNWKVVGIETGKIYATGTHADCSRAVNETKRGELVKIMRADQAFEPMDDNAEIDRLAKEWQLMELQEKQRLEDEKTKKTRVHNFDQQKWTSEEEAYVKTNINMPNKELLDGLKSHFGKTVTLKALNARKYKLRQLYNLPAIPTNRWKPEEDAYIIKNYHRLTAAKIGEAIGRTTAAVSERVQVLRRTGKFDSSKRCEPEQSNRVVPGPETSVAVRESREHPNDRMGASEMTEEIATEQAEKMDTAQIIKPDDMPDDSDISAVKIGKVVPDDSVKVDKHLSICKQLNQTYQEKNADYGDSFSETYRKLGIISAVTRISDKTNRLISLAGKPEAERMVKDESIADTLRDMANYAILTLMELEEAE